MRTLLVVVMAALWISHRAPAQQTASIPQRAARLIEGGPGEWWGDKRSNIVANFGKPDSIEVRTIRNQHDSLVVDTIVTLHYPAATFVYYVATNYQKDILGEVTLSGLRYLKRSPITLGATLAEVRAYFGDTSRGSTPHLLYSSSTPLPFKLELWFVNDRLVRLKWAYPID